jgi:rsbT co-antagonist protein RsbR
MGFKEVADEGSITRPLDASAAPEQIAALRKRLETLQSAVDALPFALFWKDRASVYLGANRVFAAHAGAPSPADVVGRTDYDLAWKRAEADAFRADDQEVITSGEAKLHIIEPQRQADGRDRWLETNKVPLRDASGQVIGVVGWYQDITARKLEEDDLVRRKDEMIRAQAEALHDLATPLLPVADGVLVMPLVGGMDQARAQQVMETLLAGVVQHRTRVAILDVTGVRRIDASVVSALVGVAHAVRLLGAEIIVTGVRPDMAQTMVQLGADLRHVAVLSDLKSGVTHAMRR